MIGCALKLLDDLESELIASIRRLIGSGSRNQHRLLLPSLTPLFGGSTSMDIMSAGGGCNVQSALFPPFLKTSKRHLITKLNCFSVQYLKICVLGGWGRKNAGGDDDDGVHRCC